MAARPRNVARVVETGAVLGVLVVALAVTGLLLSPTVGIGGTEGAGNALYAAHLSAAVLLVAFTLWHLWPLARSLARSAGTTLAAHAASLALLTLVLVEIVTGYVLLSHDYRLVPKVTAVWTHLGVTFALLVPFAWHAARGVRVAGERRAARAAARAAAVHAGKGAVAREHEAGLTRRAFLRLGAYAAVGVTLAVAFGRAVTDQIDAWRLNSVGIAPRLTRDEYRLRVRGLVGEPVELTFADLERLGPVTKRFTHRCVEGWTYTDEFTGVPLRKVLELAGGVTAGAAQVVMWSRETSMSPQTRGATYTTNVPVDDALHDDFLVVWAVGGRPMPHAHGGPVRVMSPRKWGYKACKWLQEVEVSADASYKGYWERFGYHNDGDYPGPIFA